MKSTLLGAIALSVLLSGCASKSLLVEIRTSTRAPGIKRIHIVDSTSVGSGVLRPAPKRQDDQSNYFVDHGLIHGPGTGFVIVDLDNTNRSEVYELNWIGFRNQEEWSEWLTPDFSGATDNGRHIAMRLLYDDSLSKTNQAENVSQLRYQMKRFKY